MLLLLLLFLLLLVEWLSWTISVKTSVMYHVLPLSASLLALCSANAVSSNALDLKFSQGSACELDYTFSTLAVSSHPILA